MSELYVTNFYWDSTAAPEDFVDLDRMGVDSTIVETDSEPDRAILPELRWDFDSLAPVEVAGTNARVALQRVDDADWGYRSGKTGVLRLTGTGTIQLTLPAAFDPSHFRYAYVRFRRVYGTPRTVSVAWRGASESALLADRLVSLQGRRAGEWEVAMIPLPNSAAWVTSAQGGAIALRFDGVGAVALDVDFVVVSP